MNWTYQLLYITSSNDVRYVIHILYFLSRHERNIHVHVLCMIAIRQFDIHFRDLFNCGLILKHDKMQQSLWSFYHHQPLVITEYVSLTFLLQQIISQEEATKRRSIDLEEPLPLPELIGESVILAEFHLFQVRLSMLLPLYCHEKIYS